MNLWDAVVRDWHEALPEERFFEQTTDGVTTQWVMLHCNEVGELVNLVERALRSQLRERAVTEWGVRQGTKPPTVTPFKDEETARHMAISMRYPFSTEVVSRTVGEWRAAPEPTAFRAGNPEENSQP